MASLTRNRSVPDTIPTDVNREYYVQRAESAGLVMTEGTLISPQGTNWPYAAGIWTEDHVKAWKPIVDGVHQVGGKTFMQLWHVGRIANNDMPLQKQTGKGVPAPSAIAARGGEGHFAHYGLSKDAGYSVPTPIDDPRKIIMEEFKRGAINAKAAGFDGVELHSANGYLVHEFIDSTSNQRTDEWGGSIENRCRFGLEIMKELIEVWGPGRVGIKISPCGGYDDVGMPLQETIDTFTYYVKQLVAMDIAYVQLVRYVPLMDPEFDGKKRGTPHDTLGTYGPIIQQAPNTKLVLNGGLTPDEANTLISEGKIDAAVFGVLWISNPDLHARIEKGVELNRNLDFKSFYAPADGKDQRTGYSDYPKAT